jgi:hypothetical protein
MKSRKSKLYHGVPIERFLLFVASATPAIALWKARQSAACYGSPASFLPYKAPSMQETKIQAVQIEPIKQPAANAPVELCPVPRLLLTPIEAAAALGISPRLLWSKTKIGEIPCLRIGKAVRYSPTALQAWIDGTHRVK